MAEAYCWAGKHRRLQRLRHPGSGAIFLVPLDHSLADGPVADTENFASLVEAMANNGVDGLVVHKGRVRFLPPELLRDLSLIVHLNGSTRYAPDANAKILVGSVEEAVALGADAVSVHINIGSNNEAAQLIDLGKVSDQAARWGVPLLAMVYPRGPHLTNPADPALLAHAANIAADLGADIVKLPYTGSVSTMVDVVHASPIPIVTAGGGVVAETEKLLDGITDAMASGVAGVAVGRNVFGAADPGHTARLIAQRVHVTAPPPDLLPAERQMDREATFS
ncbi:MULTISPECIES: 2-amino-3,7-dideoxy-D-threo-hept-6-ulosonate synthase [Streptomyces]|uniref:2-amino-4,5-dihydroxy-6-one-heptanoic acid-7-phosphate synthase n=2 Tax=Streptomyces TaxID=1883 RepID=A0A2N8P9S8_STRNR|nr:MULTISPECIES: 2-amino-3,7-dideoxy-D-threo-hept-6-ulosonate synthase [Streptomyces]PNE37765.1 hypothetical protein AOB60_26400 [Streptomyces noursei]SHN18954.1 2-amino-3,7-dideoxy-D-threo-hept-6-ulosonate synthase [Streptomyces yunnanensis]